MDTMNVIECSQLLTQGLWFHSNQLLQLPHFDQAQIKQLNKVLSTKATGSTIEKVKELGGEKRRECLTSLSAEQHLDVDGEAAVFVVHCCFALQHATTRCESKITLLIPVFVIYN